MYVIELGYNTIVIEKSVVTKSFLEENIVIGGNLAKVIGLWEKLKSKVKHTEITQMS